jgi:transcription elongation factor S-II
LYHEFSGETSTEYKAKFRSKYMNLANRQSGRHLRFGLLDGAIAAPKFCSMSAGEMASEERRKELDSIREANLKAAQAAKDTQAETDQFKCGRCGKRKCKYYQLQTRSADEPMTTFVTCVNCGNRWKFC